MLILNFVILASNINFNYYKKMITTEEKKEYYRALLAKDSSYEGIFFVGVITTGIFCRPTCPARKPLFKSCEFFKTAQSALLASFRPCMRCKPLLLSGQVQNIIQKLIDAVEENPEKRWQDRDFRELGIHASAARRQFKKRFGMTFVAYARARRMGIAMKQIKLGESVINTQIDTGYESASGFRDAFSRIMGVAPTASKNQTILKSILIDTILGSMIAISDEEKLYLLEFVDRRGLEREIERLRIKIKAAIVPGITAPLTQIKQELELYFAGALKEFKTPITLFGTPFQAKVWQELLKIPYGETISYSILAHRTGNPTSFRAAANANGMNQLALIIPCHRVINLNGELGGYAGGVARKKWLLDMEKANK